MQLLTVKVEGMEELKRKLSDIRKKQLPFAAAKALTRTAFKVSGAESEQVSRAFDRPKSQTIKAFKVEAAKKNTLTATVSIKSRGDGGLPANEYLQHAIDGGSRQAKRSEIMLWAAGILPKGMMTAPGAGAKLDDYGNMQRGQIAQILSYFQSYGITPLNSARMNMSVQRKKSLDVRSGYFVILPGSKESRKLFPGIYKKVGKRGYSPILHFIKSPLYSKRLEFFERAKREIDANFQREFDEAFRESMDTAR